MPVGAVDKSPTQHANAGTGGTKADAPAEVYVPDDPRLIRAAQCCFIDRGNWCTPWQHEPDRYAPAFRQARLNTQFYCPGAAVTGVVQANCRGSCRVPGW